MGALAALFWGPLRPHPLAAWGGWENGRSPVLPLPGAHLTPGLCCLLTSQWGQTGSSQEGPSAHISPQSEALAGGGGTSQAWGVPLSAPPLCFPAPHPSDP